MSPPNGFGTVNEAGADGMGGGGGAVMGGGTGGGLGAGRDCAASDATQSNEMTAIAIGVLIGISLSPSLPKSKLRRAGVQSTQDTQSARWPR